MNIPVFFTFDNNYVIPAAVAFFSLLNKAKEGVFYEMHVLHSDITAENETLLQSVVKRFKNASLEFRNTHDFLKDEWKNGNWEGHQNKNKFTLDTVIRCFAAEFFPQYDKILYSDVDIVVKDDISELWDIDLTDKYLAAVKSSLLKYCPNELSHLSPELYEKFKDSYFGGGIWVMNLKKIREDNLQQKMLDVIHDDTIVKRWLDQDIMNIACDNKTALIPLNYIGLTYLLDLIKKNDFISYYTRDELYDFLINMKIIHYANLKPWNAKVPYGEEWWTIYHYLNLYGKDEKNIFDKSLRKQKKIQKTFFYFHRHKRDFVSNSFFGERITYDKKHPQF